MLGIYLTYFVIVYSNKAEESVGDFLNPLKVLHRLEERMSDDSLIVADGGDFVGSAAYILRYIICFVFLLDKDEKKRREETIIPDLLDT